MLPYCQIRQVMVRFVWILAAASPVSAGFDAGLRRRPGLIGLRDALRSDWVRHPPHDGVAFDQTVADDGIENKDPLRCFEVHHPVLTPDGPAVDERPIARASPNDYDHGEPPCSSILMEHSFGNSYGNPFVAQYWPPECPFNRVVLRLDVVSEGRQFDRLAIMYLGDIEVWRTSTAEPKPSPGIVWTIRKDFTQYLPLWKQPQTLIFDLGNLIDNKYTGAFNATLTATFFRSSILGPNGVSADSIIPISARRGGDGKGSAFIYPEAPAETVLTLPKNINRGILTVSATGQAGEEFWWSNVPEKDKDILISEAGPLPGLSSYREVQVHIDNQLAGLSLPFPVVFTGGIAPPLHRPVVGPQAFELREHEIDISPFLGLLCDGQEHTFSIDVYGVDDTNGTVVLARVPMHWVLTGKIFLWFDQENSQTTGSAPEVIISELEYRADSTEVDEVVAFQQIVKRSFQASARVQTQRGSSFRAWHQSITMRSDQNLSEQGNTQLVEGLYEHMDSSSIDQYLQFSTKAHYPIKSHSRYREPDGDLDFSINATLNSGMMLDLLGQHVFPTGLEAFMTEPEESWREATIHTSRRGTAFFYSVNGGNNSGGRGDTVQVYGLAGAKPLYTRYVSVANETITEDREFGLGKRHGFNGDNEVDDSQTARQSHLDMTSLWAKFTEDLLHN